MKALYPGSFDPITFGHIDIINRFHDLYDEFIVLVANSPNKNYFFSSEERMELIKEVLPKGSNIRVEVFDGLTVDFAKSVGANIIVRGIRVVTDFEYEMAMAHVNKKLAPEIETSIAFAQPQYGFISSRLVKEVANYGGELSQLVPKQVQLAISAKMGS